MQAFRPAPARRQAALKGCTTGSMGSTAADFTAREPADGERHDPPFPQRPPSLVGCYTRCGARWPDRYRRNIRGGAPGLSGMEDCRPAHAVPRTVAIGGRHILRRVSLVTVAWSRATRRRAVRGTVCRARARRLRNDSDRIPTRLDAARGVLLAGACRVGLPRLVHASAR